MCGRVCNYSPRAEGSLTRWLEDAIGSTAIGDGAAGVSLVGGGGGGAGGVETMEEVDDDDGDCDDGDTE